jgi:uncharacterized membrane protein
LLAKHAQHVVLVHFPIALFLTALLFDVVARWTGKAAFAGAAQLNFIAAAVSVVPVLATGLGAWQWQLGGQKLKGVLLLHLVLGSAAGALIVLVALARRTSGRTQVAVPRYVLALEVVCAGVVALTAHLGGVLSGVTGAN